MPVVAYPLIDPRPIAAEAPYTFFLPTTAELEAVGPGDLVKLIFEHPDGAVKWAAERMWVTVEEAGGDDLYGRLDNQPDEPTAKLREGDQIAFKRHHVVDVLWSNPLTAPAPDSRRTFWERCLVDQCVLDGEEPVEFIYREAPDMQREDDSYPDSGWRIRGRVGEATDEQVDARKAAYVAVGVVLNQDDSWLGIVDAPIGTRMIRDFASDTYLTK